MKRLIQLLLAAVLIPTLAFGQPYTEEVIRQRLVGVHLQPEQARELAKLLASTGISHDNNTYLTWRNAAGSANISALKVDGSDDTVLNSDASDTVKVQIGGDSNRLFTFDASTDTALTLTFGDGGTTAVQGLTISASTADADDDATLQLGFASSSRGAGITLPGEEVSGGGDITYSAGASDAHQFAIGGTVEATINNDNLSFSGTAVQIDGAGNIIFQVDADTQRRFNLDASSDTSLELSFGDGGTTATQILDIRSRTADADDDNTLRLCGGGAYAADGSRGACLVLPGEEVAGGGDLAHIAGGSDDNVFYSGSTNTGTLTSAGSLSIAGNFTASSGNVSFGGSLLSTTTSNIGWSVVAGANTACNTTCTAGCVVGQDAGTTNIFVGCADATADVCICAGAS